MLGVFLGLLRDLVVVLACVNGFFAYGGYRDGMMVDGCWNGWKGAEEGDAGGMGSRETGGFLSFGVISWGLDIYNGKSYELFPFFFGWR